MSVPDSHKDAIFALLAQAEDMAYLIADSELNILFSSPETAGYGVSMPGNLGHAPAWLTVLRPRLAQLFERPSIFSHTTLDQNSHPISIQAQAASIEGAPRLLILLRRLGASQPHPAPYHAATGLYSASYLECKIDEELERIKRFPAVFSLLALEIRPAPHPIAPLGDVLRIHFRAIDIVGHAPDDGFLALLPGATLEQARSAGARLATLIEDFRAMLPAPIGVRYTAIEAGPADTRASLFARLSEAETLPA